MEGLEKSGGQKVEGLEKNPEKMGLFEFVDFVLVDLTENPEKLKELKKELEVDLGGVYPPETYRAITESRLMTDQLVERSGHNSKQTFEQVQVISDVALRLRELGADEVLVQQLLGAAENISLATVGIEANTNSLQDEIISSLTRSEELTRTTLEDAKTGISTLGGLVEGSVSKLMWVLEQGELSELDSTEILFIDMMLFHKGNAVLTSEGFDARIKTVLQATKSIARYLATDYNGLYRPFIFGEEETDEGMRLYFPEGSPEREQLDYLKSLGVEIWPARVNPGGGDEFAFQINYNQNKTAIEMAEARRAINNVIRNTVISTSRLTAFENDNYVLIKNDKKDEVKERIDYYHLFRNQAFTYLKVREDPDHDIGASEANRYNKFVDELRSYFMLPEVEGKYVGEGGILFDPRIDTRMDYAWVSRGENLPTLMEIDKMMREGTLFVDGLQSEDMRVYLSRMREKVARALDGKTMANQMILEREVKAFILKDVLDRFYSKLNVEVNETGKTEKKKEVYLQALTERDPQAMFVIGSAQAAGSFATFTNETKKEILDELIDYYMRIYADEDRKRQEGGRYNKVLMHSLKKFMDLEELPDRREAERVQL